MLRIGACSEHEADALEALLNFTAYIWMIESAKLAPRDRAFAQQPRADAGRFIHVRCSRPGASSARESAPRAGRPPLAPGSRRPPERRRAEVSRVVRRRRR